MHALLLIIIAYSVNGSWALIGFDCGGPQLNHTTVSLVDLEECRPPTPESKSTKKYIQLLQLSDYDHTEILQCKINIRRVILRCGMQSHVSAVHNGYAEYIQEIGYSTCLKLHQEGTITIGNTVITGIPPNSTTHRTVKLAGSLGPDGTCTGTGYSDPYGSWDKVFVQGLIEIKLRSQTVPVKIKTGKIILPSGTTCELAKMSCIDYDNGYTFWKPMPTDTCELRSYDVLYEGLADKLTENNGKNHPIVYSLTTEEVTFALTQTREHQICGYTLIDTEHPRLFILETKKGNSIVQRRPTAVDNLDIFTYINSKFVYVERHVQNQLTSLYYNIVIQKCEAERQILRNALSLVSMVPEEFAYIIAKRPGFIAVNAGEVIHILQCIPVEAKIRKTEECYNELPVLYNNMTYFLTPKTRILTQFGTKRHCNPLLPSVYKIDDQWIKFTPTPTITEAPQKTQPISTLNWRYLTPRNVAVSGIYSEKELQQLRDHIMFPAEKPAVVNEIVRGMTNPELGTNSISIAGFLDEDTLNKIARTTFSKIWDGFMEFGTISAGVIAILMIIKFVIAVIDTIVNGYALHSIYGCGLHLFGAIFTSITHLLIHLARGPPPQPEEPRELMPILSETNDNPEPRLMEESSV